MQRTTYMQSLMNRTYPGVAIEAIKNGFDGSLERLIADALRYDWYNQSENAESVLNLVADRNKLSAKDLYMKAAYLITSSLPVIKNDK